LNIVCCIKQVPDSAATLTIDAEGKISWGDSPLIVNPYDEYSLEEGLQLKEAHGGKVTALTMGKEGAKEALKTALAMGCEEAILISDPAFAGADTLVTAYVLAQAIKKIGGVELVLFGQASIDGQSGQTAASVARQLGFNVLTYVSKIRTVDPATATITVERLLEEGKQVVTSKLPLVMSTIKGINEPRYPSFMGIRKAAKAEIPTWSAADIGAEAGKLAAAVKWSKVSAPPPREGKCEMITGDSPEQIAAALVDKILEAKIL
jgi:electron transfer flavoprotein beta subunit